MRLSWHETSYTKYSIEKAVLNILWNILDHNVYVLCRIIKYKELFILYLFNKNLFFDKQGLT